MSDAVRSPAVPAPALRDAERACAAMARREAKNFYWGFLALPREQRVSVYALYDFARQVDDAVDGLTPEDARPRLLEHRERLRRCAAGEPGDDVMLVLGEAVRRCAVPAAELAQIIDGVEMDLERTSYATWPELEAYCHLVASAVGRVCVRIFGYRDPVALDLARDLGVAMQLTNILRDVREDLGLGRVYLPCEELARFGVDPADLVRTRLGPEWDRFVRFQAERASAYFATGLGVTRFIPRSSAACVRTMAGIYQALLRHIEDDPQVPLRERISLPAAAKLRVAVGAWLPG